MANDAGLEGIVAAIGPIIATVIAQLKPMASAPAAMYGVNSGTTAAHIMQPRSLASTIMNQVLGMPQNNDMNALANIGSGAVSPMQAIQAGENARRMYQMRRDTASAMFSAGVGMSDTALKNWGVSNTERFREMAVDVKEAAAGSAAMGVAIQFGSAMAAKAAGQFGMFTQDATDLSFKHQTRFAKGGMYNVNQAQTVYDAAYADLQQIRAFQATGKVDGAIKSLIPDTKFSRGFTDLQLLQQRSFLRAQGVTGLDKSEGMTAMAGMYKNAAGLLGTTDSDALNRFIHTAGGNGMSGVRVQQLEEAFKNLTAMAVTLNVNTENFSRSVLGLQHRTATAGGLSGTALAAGGGGLLGNNAITGGGAMAALRLDHMANKAGISSDQMQDVYAAQLGDFRGSMQGRTLAYYNTYNKDTYNRLKAVAMTGNQSAWNKAMQGALSSTFGSVTAGRSALSDPRLQEIMFGQWDRSEEMSVTMGTRNAARREQGASVEADMRLRAATGKYGAYASSKTADAVRGQAIINSLSGDNRAMAEQAFRHGGTRQLENLLNQQSFVGVRDAALAAGKLGVAGHLEHAYGETNARYNAVNAIAALADPQQQKQLRGIATAIRSGKMTGAQTGVLANMLQQNPEVQKLWNSELGAERKILAEASKDRNLSAANTKLSGLLSGNAENDALFAAAAKNGTGATLSGHKLTEEQVRLLHGRRRLLMHKYGSAEEQHNLGPDNAINESELKKNMAENAAYAAYFEKRNPLMYDDFKTSFGKFMLNKDQASLGAMLGNDRYAPYMNALNRIGEGKDLTVEDASGLKKIGSSETFAAYVAGGGDSSVNEARFGQLVSKRKDLLKASDLLTMGQNSIFDLSYDDYKKKTGDAKQVAVSEEVWGAAQSMRKMQKEMSSPASTPGSVSGAGGSAEISMTCNGKPVVNGKIDVEINPLFKGDGVSASALED